MYTKPAVNASPAPVVSTTSSLNTGTKPEGDGRTGRTGSTGRQAGRHIAGAAPSGTVGQSQTTETVLLAVPRCMTGGAGSTEEWLPDGGLLCAATPCMLHDSSEVMTCQQACCMHVGVCCAHLSALPLCFCSRRRPLPLLQSQALPAHSAASLLPAEHAGTTYSTRQPWQQNCKQWLDSWDAAALEHAPSLPTSLLKTSAIMCMLPIFLQRLSCIALVRNTLVPGQCCMGLVKLHLSAPPSPRLLLTQLVSAYRTRVEQRRDKLHVVEILQVCVTDLHNICQVEE